jgi:hypothetical protein
MAGDNMKLGVDRQWQSSVSAASMRRLFLAVTQHYQG